MLVSKEKWEEHMKVLHPPGLSHWCDQCNYTFLTEDGLGSHNKKSTPARELRQESII